jgi:hypothetical protein
MHVPSKGIPRAVGIVRREPHKCFIHNDFSHTAIRAMCHSWDTGATQ